MTERMPEGVTLSSVCVSNKNILKLFNGIEIYLKEKKYCSILNDPQRIYNGDESCYLLHLKKGKVLAPKGC